MSKTAKITLSIFIGFLLLSDIKLKGHGFSERTAIRTKDGYKFFHEIWKHFDPNSSDREINELKLDPYRWVQSCSEPEHRTYGYIKGIIKGSTNCYYEISLFNDFNINPIGHIECTPTQVFYLPEHNTWVPAHKLKVGDLLLAGNCDYFVPITHIKLINKPITVYSIKVVDHHNFMVGDHAVLTHNMAFPQLTLSISIPYGEGAIAGGVFGSASGGSVGSFFGPVSIAFGCILGGILGLTYTSTLGTNDVPHYKLELNPNYKLEFNVEQLENDNNEYHNTDSSGTGAASGGFPEDPNDPYKRSRYSSNQMKKLSEGEIKKLKAAGIDVHDLKPNSKFDLFKDVKGNIVIKPKDGSGKGDPTGININKV